MDTGPEPDVSKQGNTAGLKPRKEGTRLEWRAHASTRQHPPAWRLMHTADWLALGSVSTLGPSSEASSSVLVGTDPCHPT